MAGGVAPRHVAAALAGNALEFYDFLTYAFFAVYIGAAFFPAGSAYASLMLSVAVFGVGFVLRPLGGLAIGAYGDRAGRRPAMLLSLALISLGTIGLAVTPSYARIGIAAPVIVIACRMVQGFALGGEVGPSTAFLLEAAPDGRRALYGSLQGASQFSANILASGIGFAISLIVPAASLAAWGWRIPFLLGAAAVPLLAIMRRNLPETARAGGRQADAAPRAVPVRDVLLCAAVVSNSTIITYFNVYLTTYALSALHLRANAALAAGVIGACAGLLGALTGGALGDRVGRKPVLFWPRLVLMFLLWPAFALLSRHPAAPNLFVVAAGLGFLAGMSGATVFALAGEVLPRRQRSGVFAVTYALSVAIFGGTAQLVFTWLIRWVGHPAAPALYVMGATVLGLLAVRRLPETLGRGLD